MSRVGVITVTYNSALVLDDFLHSVWSQRDAEFLLFTIDSASTDGTQEHLRNLTDSRARIVLLQENVGFAAANNVGIRLALEAGCDAILLINNDTSFPPDLFHALLAGLDRYECDMTTPKMLRFDRPKTIWSAGGNLNRWLGYRNAQIGQNQPDGRRFNVARKVTFTPFCCIMMRSSVFRVLGEMDENYFVYTEDNDYCFQALKANLSIWYVPEAMLRHKVSALTGGAETPFLIRYCTRNRIYFLQKNLPSVLAWAWTTTYRLYYLCRWWIGMDTKAVWSIKWQAATDGIRMHRDGHA